MSSAAGRIRSTIPNGARLILFGDTADQSIDNDLTVFTEIDRAHLVMLAEQGILARPRAAHLLQEINNLRRDGFAPLRGRPAPRGLYLFYEEYLIECTGVQTGGALHTGRSRNDLNATAFLMKARAPYATVAGALLELSATVLARANSAMDAIMPAYTHGQAAVPITYGHYLLGICTALVRDVEGLLECAGGLDLCPLGAGAVGGTTIAIDTARTADLLGFRAPTVNSVDAVASRDLVLRLLAAAAVAGVTLSRCAQDLQTWLSSEYRLLWLPDELVGSSSMMPQKRNPYFLEHVQGRSSAAAGAFTAALTAMHAKPFSNAIAVATEATRQLWDPLRQLTEAAQLLRLVVEGAQPQRQRMLEAATVGMVSATELANRLAIGGGMGFRAAHGLVGELIGQAPQDIAADFPERGAAMAASYGLHLAPAELEPAAVAAAAEFGGGPGPRACNRVVDSLERLQQQQWQRLRGSQQLWNSAEQALDAAASELSQVRD